MSLTKLNIGCGRDIRSGWINLDRVKLPGVDLVYNIEKVPLPFQTNSFESVLCRDIFEHIEYIPVLGEIHRILKKDGILTIRVPHFSSRRNFEDPTHKKMFSVRTFEFFIKNSRTQRDYYFSFHFSQIASVKIVFEKNYFFYNYLFEKIINNSKKLKETIYEATCLARLFPAEYLIIKLIK